MATSSSKSALNGYLEAGAESARRLDLKVRRQCFSLEVALRMFAWHRPGKLADAARQIRARFYPEGGFESHLGYALPSRFLSRVLVTRASALDTPEVQVLIREADRYLANELDEEDRVMLWLLTPANPTGRGRSTEGPYLAVYTPEALEKLDTYYSPEDSTRYRYHLKTARRRCADYVARLLGCDCSQAARLGVLEALVDELSPRAGMRLEGESRDSLIAAAQIATQWLEGVGEPASRELEKWTALLKKLEFSRTVN